MGGNAQYMSFSSLLHIILLYQVSLLSYNKWLLAALIVCPIIEKMSMHSDLYCYFKNTSCLCIIFLWCSGICTQQNGLVSCKISMFYLTWLGIDLEQKSIRNKTFHTQSGEKSGVKASYIHINLVITFQRWQLCAAVFFS